MRICLVNCLAPPLTGSRSERWLHLSRALVALGHHVTWIRAEPPRGIKQDLALQKLLESSGVTRVTLPCGASARWYFQRRKNPFHMATFAASQLIWPDPWAMFAHHAIQYLQNHPYSFDVVISSAVPFSNHLVGYEAARMGIPWYADYGDPVGLSFLDNTWVPNAQFQVETNILTLASALLVNTLPLKSLFEKYFNKEVLCLPSGIEPLALPSPPEQPLQFLHAGAIYPPRTTILPFLQAFEKFRRNTRPDAQLIWCGRIESPQEQQKVLAVADKRMDYVTHEVLSVLEQQSHVLLIFGNHGGTQIPAKIWRALGTNRILLVILADSHDPLKDVPELQSHIFVENHADAILRGLEKCMTPTHNTHPVTSTWHSRAEALTAFLGTPRTVPVVHRTHLPARHLMDRATLLGLRLPKMRQRILKHAKLFLHNWRFPR